MVALKGLQLEWPPSEIAHPSLWIQRVAGHMSFSETNSQKIELANIPEAFHRVHQLSRAYYIPSSLTSKILIKCETRVIKKSQQFKDLIEAHNYSCASEANR